FQRLSLGNGTNPFRLAPGPRLIPLHVPACARTNGGQSKSAATTTSVPPRATSRSELRMTARPFSPLNETGVRPQKFLHNAWPYLGWYVYRRVWSIYYQLSIYHLRNLPTPASASGRGTEYSDRPPITPKTG